MRIGLAVFMILHGIAHFVGFAVPWRLVRTEEPYHTTILGGLLELGEGGIRIYSIVWLLLGLAFVGTAIGLLMRAEWWYETALMLAATSIVFCLLSLPETGIGIAVNLFVAASVLVSGRLLGEARIDS